MEALAQAIPRPAISDRRGCCAELCGPVSAWNTYKDVADVAIQDRQVDRTRSEAHTRRPPVAAFFYRSGSTRYIYPFLLAVAVREDVEATDSDSPSMSVRACEVAMLGIVAVRVGYFRIHRGEPGCPKIY